MLDMPTLGNAAGTCKTLEHFEILLRSAVDTITIGSVTVKQRNGNPDNPYYRNSAGHSVNSLGLPNQGMDYYEKHLPRMLERAQAAGRQVSVSIAAIEKGDNEELANRCLKLGVKIIELNAGCPNVWDNGEQKRILAFDAEALYKEVFTVRTAMGSVEGELRIKLSPYSDPVQLSEAAAVFKGLKARLFTIVTSNTFPNGFMLREDERPAISFGKHLGGYAGTGLKPIALGQVAQFRDLLPDHRIIGVGGIETGRDLLDYVKVGAQGGQIGSAYYFTENPRIFSDVLTEYVGLTES